jgi:hypothetical protein
MSYDNLSFITLMVLYSIIKPYNSLFMINRHIARQNFILNDPFSGGRNPGKILKLTSQTFSKSVAMTSHDRICFNESSLRDERYKLVLFTSTCYCHCKGTQGNLKMYNVLCTLHP